jgi:multiple antibiotic resistance protein
MWQFSMHQCANPNVSLNSNTFLNNMSIFAEIFTLKFMGIDWKEVFTISMILFAVIDILGSIPIIVDLRSKIGHIQSEKATIVSAIIMIAFLFVGEEILKLIGIDANSFAVAGSFVLFFLALEMILGVRLYKEDNPTTASIVPIAFPLIAGAGTMTTLLSLRAAYDKVNIIIAILINVVLVYGVLKSSGKIEKLLGVNGLGIIRKVFGVILLAISIKLFAANVKGLFI